MPISDIFGTSCSLLLEWETEKLEHVMKCVYIYMVDCFLHLNRGLMASLYFLVSSPDALGLFSI